MSTEGGGGRKSFKVMKIEVKVILACFGYTSIKVMLTINRERSEQKREREKIAIWAKKVIGPQPLGVAPP